jgi:hypothetical protein
MKQTPLPGLAMQQIELVEGLLPQNLIRISRVRRTNACAFVISVTNRSVSDAPRKFTSEFPQVHTIVEKTGYLVILTFSCCKQSRRTPTLGAKQRRRHARMRKEIRKSVNGLCPTRRSQNRIAAQCPMAPLSDRPYHPWRRDRWQAPDTAKQAVALTTGALDAHNGGSDIDDSTKLKFPTAGASACTPMS